MNLDYFRSFRTVPRVHGNGFIQLDTRPGERLHVWGHPAVPRQRVDTGIHDHKFGFTSRVLVGRVVNVTWSVKWAPEGWATHKTYSPQTRDGEDTVLVNASQLVVATIYDSETVLKGHAYSMLPGGFHETITDRPSATVMNKNEHRSTSPARVLVPIGEEPDNDFNRNAALDARRLWEIIEEVLGS